MTRIIKISTDAAGNHFAHIRDRQQIFQGSRSDRIDVAEMGGNLLGRRFPDIPDSQRKQDPVKRDFTGFRQTVQETFRRPLFPAVQRDQQVRGQVIEIRRRTDKAPVVELLDGGVAGDDIHGLTAQEMNEASLGLGRTAIRIGAEELGFTFFLDQRSPAIRADGRENRPDGSGRTPGEFYPGNLRNDFPAFFHIDAVADPDVQQSHLRGVVQRRTLDHGAGQQYRFQIRDRCHGSRPSDLVINGKDRCQRFFRLEFIGDRPAWELGRIAQLDLAGRFVDLDNDTVRSVGEGMTGRIPMIDISFDFRYIPADPAFLRNRQAPAGRGVKRLRMGRESQALCRDMIQRAPQAAPADFFRIQ